MSMYQDTPPDPSTAPSRRRTNPFSALIIIAVLAAIGYGINYLNNTREVTDTFEEFSVSHPAFWAQRNIAALYDCEAGAVAGCIADYVSNGRAANIEILMMRFFSFTGGTALDNGAVQSAINGGLNNIGATVTSREDITLSGLPAQRIEFYSTDARGLLFVVKPSLYIHFFFALAEEDVALVNARSDIEAFMQGVKFNVPGDEATGTPS